MNKLFRNKKVRKVTSIVCVISMAVSIIVMNPNPTEVQALSLWQLIWNTLNNKNEAEPVTTTQPATEEITVIVTTTVKEPEMTEKPTEIETTSAFEITTEPETTTQVEIITEPETTTQAEVITEPETTTQTEVITEPETTTQPEVTTEPETTTQPEVTTEPMTEAEITTEVETHGLTPGKSNQKTVSDKKVQFNKSLIENTSKLQYYIDGDNYRYGITKDGREVLSFLADDGSCIDALMGAGGYIIRDTSFWGYISYTSGIESFTKYEVDGVKSLIVYYTTNNGAKSYTIYKFYDNHVNITSSIKGVNSKSVGTSFFQRDFVNGYIDYELKENTKWMFPDNGDFPYKDFESIASTHYLDSKHKMYTFFRGEQANTYNYFDGYTAEHFPLTIQDNKFDSYELTYDLVFENLQEDRDSDYLALFMSDGSDVATGITPVTKSVETSTIFTTNNIEFNINLTNLLKKNSKYSLEYKIYDYYSNVYNNTKETGILVAGKEANYPVVIKNMKSGIYYLDVQVTTGNGTYHEIYPFGYLPEYKYQYNSTSPFGISGIRFGDYQQNDTTVALMSTLGMANARIGISKPEYVNESYDLLNKYLNQLKGNGTRITGQYLLMNDWSFSSNAKAFQSEMEKTLSVVGKYLTDCEVGNETNLYPQYKTMSEAMSRYLTYEFNPGLKALSNSKLDIVASGVYLSQYAWFAEMVSSGVWNKTSVLSTHAYSFPHSPDHVNDASIDHSFESALVRTRNYLNAYGDKTWYISEMGAPTTPLNNQNMFSGVDLRTQADYTFREFILGLAYGADVLQSYGFYDQVNMQKGTNPYNCEYHYGMFYDQDYFGRVMPKPLALAYGSMTRNLESVTDCYAVSLSSATVRAFGITLQKQAKGINNFILWSNCSMLSNDAVEGTRTPNLPWNNQWKKSEKVVVYSASVVTVTDIMGNTTSLTPNAKGEVSISVTGSPIMISGEIYGSK